MSSRNEIPQAELSLTDLVKYNYAIWGYSTDIEDDYDLTSEDELNFD